MRAGLYQTKNGLPGIIAVEEVDHLGGNFLAYRPRPIQRQRTLFFACLVRGRWNGTRALAAGVSDKSVLWVNGPWDSFRIIGACFNLTTILFANHVRLSRKR